MLQSATLIRIKAMTNQKTDHFSEERAQGYDERNQKLAAIIEGLHFLTRLVLKNLPDQAKILSVGAGTGAEILYLAKAFPEWSFVAVEPSMSMLNVCKERLKSEGFIERCEFIHGYVQDVPLGTEYDAALAFLVAHFVGREERLAFYQGMIDRLKEGGYLVNAEISYDLQSKEFPAMLNNWQEVQRLMGGTPESLKTLPKVLKEMLTVLSPEETEAVLKKSGIPLPVKYYQAFLISAWYGIKSS